MGGEDLALYFDTDATAGLASAVTLDGQAKAAIFDNEYQLGTVANTGMATTMPMLTLPTSSVPASPVGKAAVVGGVTYTVVEHQPDGTGVSRLMLERA